MPSARGFKLPVRLNCTIKIGSWRKIEEKKSRFPKNTQCGGAEKIEGNGQTFFAMAKFREGEEGICGTEKE